jgi:hypothetical protein
MTVAIIVAVAAAVMAGLFLAFGYVSGQIKAREDMRRGEALRGRTSVPNAAHYEVANPHKDLRSSQAK